MNFIRGRNKAATEKEQIVIIEKVFKSKYLRAVDVESPFFGTVEGVEMKLFDDGEKPVLMLDSGQMVVLNRTRATALAAGFGTSETEAWSGRRLKVSVERIPYRGKPVDAIKLAVPEKEEADTDAAPVTGGPVTDDDIPF